MSRLPLIAATAIALASTAVIATAHDAGTGRPDHATRLLERFDTDGDGTVTRAEIAAAEAARFAEADADGNGTLSAEELLAMHEARRLERQLDRMGRVIERLDENGDGVLSAEEAAAMHRGHDRIFDLIDADDDGAITQAELEEMGEFRRGRWGRDHGHGAHEDHGPRGGMRGWWGRGGH